MAPFLLQARSQTPAGGSLRRPVQYSELMRGRPSTLSPLPEGEARPPVERDENGWLSNAPGSMEMRSGGRYWI
jgi:hypothetical protein